MKNGTTHKTTKGYLRVTAGPCRHAYVHRIVAAAWIGRELKKDEQVHHRNGDRLDPRHTNLFILGESDHSWVSAKQAWFMQNIYEPAEKREWDEFMEDQAEQQVQAVTLSKADNFALEVRDGEVKAAWEKTHPPPPNYRV
jgi:HNH endonuclease